MDGPYVWEPCRGVTDGDRHARVCRGSTALVWCAWMWGEAVRSPRAVCVLCVCLSRARNVQQGLPGHGGEVLMRCQRLLPGCKIRHSQLQRS